MVKRKKEDKEIIDILNIKDEYQTEDLINYINELDVELQRLIRNLIKLKSRANPDRAAFKESPDGPKMDKHLLFTLERHGFDPIYVKQSTFFAFLYRFVGKSLLYPFFRLIKEIGPFFD